MRIVPVVEGGWTTGVRAVSTGPAGRRIDRRDGAVAEAGRSPARGGPVSPVAADDGEPGWAGVVDPGGGCTTAIDATPPGSDDLGGASIGRSSLAGDCVGLDCFGLDCFGLDCCFGLDSFE